MKPAKGKTWTEKVNDETKDYQVKMIEKSFADIPAKSLMFIATPKIIDEYVRQIPKGKSSTMQTMRNDLAHEFKAEYTCPLTAGIFLRIVAEAAFEQIQQGKPISKVTPFWRMLDEKSPMLKKLSFGSEFVVQQRKKEGLVTKAKTKE